VQPEEPVVEENLPAKQFAHCVPPVVSLYVPTEQPAHPLCPAVDIFPEAQDWQLVEPVPLAKVPALH